MRLKDLRINQVSFWYQTYLGEEDEVDEDGNYTGDTVAKYSSPVQAHARISPNVGEAVRSPFGASLQYDKQISTVQNLPIDEHTKLFIEVPSSEEPDYECVGVAKDLQQNVWAIRRIRDGH